MSCIEQFERAASDDESCYSENENEETRNPFGNKPKKKKSTKTIHEHSKSICVTKSHRKKITLLCGKEKLQIL